MSELPRTEPTKREHREIDEILLRARPLCDWLRANKPSCRTVRVAQKDMELITRWPRAAAQHGIRVTAEGVEIIVGGGQFYIAAGAVRTER